MYESFACSISVRAYRTALACKILMRRCAATADVLRTGLHVQVSRVRRNQASACCCTAFATQRVRSKVESLRALHQYTSVRRRLALHTAPATLVARPAPVGPLSSWSHCGRFVHERRHLRPLALRCVCNSACDGRVAAPVYMPMQWNTVAGGYDGRWTRPAQALRMGAMSACHSRAETI